MAKETKEKLVDLEAKMTSLGEGLEATNASMTDNLTHLERSFHYSQQAMMDAMNQRIDEVLRFVRQPPPRVDQGRDHGSTNASDRSKRRERTTSIVDLTPRPT
ncbi:NADH:ubiquinone oxidoreductase [Striga asiatica]|uniref:NADH:ubiquinone oxidoreductase n=1 Tax=Striga asiatica TaxID=4170 RepID=A0A5A7QCL3_STRAF|nr:NADH:ubiquinone oxidoreductase [Striga asiatica]